jgi:hypothetical protein
MKHSSKYIILCIACLAVVLPACVMIDSGVGTDSRHDQYTIIGSGRLVFISFGFRDFTRISLSHSFKATIRKSASYAVTMEVDDNIKQYVVARQSGAEVSIGLEDNSYSNVTVNITIETPDVTMISLSGSGALRLDGFDLSHDLQIVGTGATSISGNLTARDVTFNLTGSSTVDLTGTSASLDVYSMGATQLSLFEFPVKNCRVNLTGGSVSNVRVSDNLEVCLTGGSVLRYKGNPSTKIVSVTGGSVIQKVG